MRIITTPSRYLSQFMLLFLAINIHNMMEILNESRASIKEIAYDVPHHCVFPFIFCGNLLKFNGETSKRIHNYNEHEFKTIYHYIWRAIAIISIAHKVQIHQPEYGAILQLSG